MPAIVVTGAGRGLGLELARQFSHQPDTTVFATTRGNNAPPELEKLISGSDGRVVHVHCEATDSSSVTAAAKEIEQNLSGKGIDILVNNIGVISTFSIQLLCLSPLL